MQAIQTRFFGPTNTRADSTGDRPDLIRATVERASRGMGEAL